MKKKSTYSSGRPLQFDGSNTFNKQGIPSVGMAPGSMDTYCDIGSKSQPTANETVRY